MFNNGDKKEALPVQLALSDGRNLEGQILLPASSSLTRTLNGETEFLDFESQSGVKSIIAKSAIVELVLTTPAG